jgi:fibronectin-binding autotransporter adhesin
MAILKNTIVEDTAFLKFPVGTTAERPSNEISRTRFNSSTNQLEVFDGVAWINIWQLSGYMTATGGTISFANTNQGNFAVHTFTSSGTFNITSVTGVPNVEVLIVAGGGGGGSDAGGGGGGGGVVHGYFEGSGVGEYSVVVGAGGSGAIYNPTNGNDSSIQRTTAPAVNRGRKSFGNITNRANAIELAQGGGGGCNGILMHGTSGLFDAHQSEEGGSGGGAGPLESLSAFTFTSMQPGRGTRLQGTGGGGSMNYAPFTDTLFKGGGGGGGAQRPGMTAPNGGPPVHGGGSGGDGYAWRGLYSNNAATHYGGGGSGGSGTFDGQPYNINSLGGGGKGGFFSGATRVAAENGGINTGGGGGGANVSTGSTPGTNRFQGAAGGSGIVFIKYRIS